MHLNLGAIQEFTDAGKVSRCPVCNFNGLLVQCSHSVYGAAFALLNLCQGLDTADRHHLLAVKRGIALLGRIGDAEEKAASIL